MAKTLRVLTDPDFTTKGSVLTKEEADQDLIDIWNEFTSGSGTVNAGTLQVAGTNLFPDGDPQDLGTGDAPTFAGLTSDGLVTVNNSLRLSSTAPQFQFEESDVTDNNARLVLTGSVLRIQEVTDGFTLTRTHTDFDLTDGSSTFYGTINANGGTATDLILINGNTDFGIGNNAADSQFIRYAPTGGTHIWKFGSRTAGSTMFLDESKLNVGVALDINGSQLSDTSRNLTATTTALGTSLTPGSVLTVGGDADVQGNLSVTGGLFAKEFQVDVTKVQFDNAMSPGGGVVSSVSGTAGSEVITFEDENGTVIEPVAADDILHIQIRTGAGFGTIVKNIWRKVASIDASSNITLTDTGITWTAGTANDDSGSIEVGDHVVVKGNTTDTTRDHYISFKISNVTIPQIGVFDTVTDVDDGGNEIVRVGGLGSFNASTSGNAGFAVQDGSGNLGFYASESTVALVDLDVEGIITDSGGDWRIGNAVGIEFFYGSGVGNGIRWYDTTGPSGSQVGHIFTSSVDSALNLSATGGLVIGSDVITLGTDNILKMEQRGRVHGAEVSITNTNSAIIESLTNNEVLFLFVSELEGGGKAIIVLDTAGSNDIDIIYSSGFEVFNGKTPDGSTTAGNSGVYFDANDNIHIENETTITVTYAYQLMR